MKRDCIEKQIIERLKRGDERAFRYIYDRHYVLLCRFAEQLLNDLPLAEEVVDPDDIEMLEDLIMAATNEALRKVEEESAAVMSKLTGGLGGGFPF